MKNFTTLIALATFATHAAAVSSAPQYDIHPLSPPFTLVLYAECNTDQCIANGSVEPVVTKTVGDEMVGTTMLDYLEDEKGEGGKRKVAAITLDSTTDGVGEQFWVDDARAGGIHIACNVTTGGQPDGPEWEWDIEKLLTPNLGPFQVGIECEDAPLWIQGD